MTKPTDVERESQTLPTVLPGEPVAGPADASVAGEEDPGAALDGLSHSGGTATRGARITGKVEYRAGDGASIVIRPGPCQVVETLLDATISWTDGETRGSAAIPIADYRLYVSSKALRLDDST